jgi:hypothetical protein
MTRSNLRQPAMPLIQTITGQISRQDETNAFDR